MLVMDLDRFAAQESFRLSLAHLLGVDPNEIPARMLEDWLAAEHGLRYVAFPVGAAALNTRMTERHPGVRYLVTGLENLTLRTVVADGASGVDPQLKPLPALDGYEVGVLVPTSIHGGRSGERGHDSQWTKREGIAQATEAYERAFEEREDGGQCFRMSLAYLLDLELEQVPHFMGAKDVEVAQINRNVDHWLHTTHGLRLVHFYLRPTPSVVLDHIARSYPGLRYLMSVWTRIDNDEGGGHALIAQDGQIVVDAAQGEGDVVHSECGGGYLGVQLLVPTAAHGAPPAVVYPAPAEAPENEVAA